MLQREEKRMITPIEPKVNKEGRYSVTETNSLRKYTELGLIKCGLRKQTGRKFYLGHEIIRFWRTLL